MNNRIVHIIDSLTTGGAEMLLKNTVSLLNDFEHCIVFLYPRNEMMKEFEGRVEFICLDHRDWSSILSTVKSLRKIIREKQPLLVHSHLFVSTICARLAVPREIPLVTSLHSTYSVDAFQKNKKSIWAERFTLKSWHNLVAVSNYVLKDYLDYVPFKGKKFVLHNFLPSEAFEQKNRVMNRPMLKCVAVGNLKEAKNYLYLLEIIAGVKGLDISLDIYGEGALRGPLQQKIDIEGLPVTLCSNTQDVLGVIEQYDLFIQASAHEGFGISVIEAMARGIPVLISDIPVFREISGNHAHFFPLDNKEAAASMLRTMQEDENERRKHVQEAFDYCCRNYSVDIYRRNLLSIYEAATGKKLLPTVVDNRL
jgi:glycosyltransferase involved in cell wall biosynthesis